MKVAALLLVLVAFAASAPQPRKDFHEHFEDFITIIMEEAGDEIEHIFEHYLEFEEFQGAVEYAKTANFKELIFEMESLPQFQAVVDFLENDNIDISFFLDGFNDALNGVFGPSRGGSLRHELSGTDFSAFIQDCIDVFPQEKLAALFDQKMAEDDDFKTAIENLFSEEWKELFTTFVESPEFQNEATILGGYGIDVKSVFDEILAVFGQKM